MDDFKAEMHRACGKGGIKCPCCNDYNNSKKHKAKKKLDRIARHRISQKDKKDLTNL